MSNTKVKFTELRRQLNTKSVNSYYNWLAEMVEYNTRLCANTLDTAHANTDTTTPNGANINALLHSGLFSSHYLSIITRLSLYKELLAARGDKRQSDHQSDDEVPPYVEISTLEAAITRRLVGASCHQMNSTDSFSNLMHIEKVSALSHVAEHLISRREAIDYQLEQAVLTVESNDSTAE